MGKPSDDVDVDRLLLDVATRRVIRPFAKTVGDLRRLSDYELMRMPNIWAKRFAKIRAACEQDVPGLDW